MFVVDCRIHESCLYLGDWPLSRVYLKKDANFPWCILLPRVENIQEMHQLTAEQSQLLIKEMTTLSRMMETYFEPDKMNIGALGNIVSQLHVHVVARFQEDKAWPHSIWQPGLVAAAYDEDRLKELTQYLSQKIKDSQIV